MEKIRPDYLISAVHSRPVLWEEGHKDHKNKKVTDKRWNEVGEICNCSGKIAKCKWKNLKDTYRRINHKVARSIAKNEPIEVKWPYFEMMSFVKTTTDMTLPSANPKQENVNDTQDFDISEYCKIRNPKRKLENYTEEEYLCDVPEENVYNSKPAVVVSEKKMEDNDDMQFFKSLLPFMAKFSDIEKLELRSEIQNVILQKIKQKRGQ